ncbi:MAG: glycoside hydrolase [Bacteroides sp.]|nr:glycoside hydrolase [Bacteroides sp.]
MKRWLTQRPGGVSSAPGVTVQWNQEQQNIDGFGICQGHADDLYAHHKRSEIMNWLYGDQGLRLNIYRGEISTFFSPAKNVYDFGFDRNVDISYDDPLFDLLGQESDPAHAELYMRAQHWVFREVKKVHHVEKMIFSAWSPPTYMKNKLGNISSLKVLQYQNYANYLVKFVREFQKNGYPIYAISPANEPEYAASWTSCVWLPGSTTLGPFIVNYLGPSLKKANLNTKIIFGENAQWSGILGFILGSANYTANIINLNPRIKNFDVIAAGHGYEDPITKERPAIAPFSKALQRGMPVWLTEVSSIDYANIRWGIQDGLKWAADWHRYLSDANTSALIYWLGAVPGRNDEGLIYMDMENREDYTLTKRYETFGNFSRYIEVDSRRVTVKRGCDLPADLHVSSYKKDNKLVVVVVNVTKKHVQTPLLVNGINVESLQRVLTDADHRWTESNVELINGKYILDIPGESVVTFVGTVK